MAFIHSQHQLTLTFGLLGNVISFLVYLAPVPTFYRIYRKKSTEGFQSLPYLVALFSSMLWLYYALLKKNAELLITINSFGCVVEMIYIAMYIAYAPNVPRKFTVKVFVSMNMGLFSLIALTSHFLVNGSHRVIVLGWICVAISVSVFAAPLSIVAQVIRTRSVEFMPFTLSFFLTLSAIMWFAYGLFLKDICIALPNILGFVLGLLQMLLYGLYRNSKRGTEEQNIKSIVILSTLGASEVYPLDAQPYNIANKDAKKEHDQQTVVDVDLEKSMEPPVHELQAIECTV